MRPNFALFLGLLSFILGISACFDPSRSNNLTCSDEGLCPSDMLCDTDNICRSTLSDDTRDARENIDAAIPIDATPVRCTNTVDCATPPNPCFLPGECNLDTNRCSFPSVVCNDPEACATYSCNPNSGDCEKTPLNEGTTCDSGTTCDPYGTCDFAGGPCQNNGIQSRDCVDRRCLSGTCTAFAPRVETQGCIQDTSGDTCMASTCGSFGQCGGFDPENLICDTSGTHSRTCIDFTCEGGICLGANRDDSEPCLRDTEGIGCGDFMPPNSNACCVAGNCLLIGLGCDPF